MNLIDDAVCRPPTNTLTQQPEFRIRDDTAVLPHTEACGRPRHPDDPADRLTALESSASQIKPTGGICRPRPRGDTLVLYVPEGRA